jgi:hypothetical protein
MTKTHAKFVRRRIFKGQNSSSRRHPLRDFEQFLHIVVKIVIGQSWSIIIRSVLNCGNLPIEVQILTGSGFDREIMCLALANSAAAQGAAGTGTGAAAAAGAGAGGVVIGGVAIGAVPLAIGAVVLVAAVAGGGTSGTTDTVN